MTSTLPVPDSQGHDPRTGSDGTAARHPGREDLWHPALFYRSPEEYLATAVPFLAEALTAGHPAAVAAPRKSLTLLRDALAADPALDPDAVTWVDMTAAGRNPGRIIPGVLRAFADRHPHAPVRIIGEPIWAGRSRVEYPACVQHEALINAAFTGRPVAILCPYDAAALDDRVLADAAVTHPVLVDGDVTTVSDRYDLGLGVAAGNRPLPDPAGPVVELAIDDSTLMRARTTVIEQAVEAGLTRERALDAELAVNELTCNTVIHGGGRGILRIWTTGEHFVCQVDDGGHITDPLAGRRPVPPHVPGGRGLLLVNQLADLVRIHTGPGATTIRVHFDRPPRPRDGI